ncbi:hypothetical protein EVAR_97925_1 [Eumeta japonica]|uniref:Uncharacterized protein n=1 Tax=Eumeta variegata TaxID=151549 RepID=A0A4C1XYF3_EUMVA|nr:hypothetical protein EVAR_97925_1 [Eumeta japonica]
MANIQYRGMMGLLYAVWVYTCVSIVQFYMISVSAISYSISEVMTGLRCAIQKILPKKYDEDTALEENHNEDLYRTLKRTEDAYDDLCNCCSTCNEVFGFSNIFSGSLTSLLIWISFYALVMVAAACESVHHAARDLHRHLALFNSEIHGGDKFLEVRVLARDVLHTVRARQPRLSACGLFDLRMSLVAGFLSLTATVGSARTMTTDERGRGQAYRLQRSRRGMEQKLALSKANDQTVEAVCLELEQRVCV